MEYRVWGVACTTTNAGTKSAQGWRGPICGLECFGTAAFSHLECSWGGGKGGRWRALNRVHDIEGAYNISCVDDKCREEECAGVQGRVESGGH